MLSKILSFLSQELCRVGSASPFHFMDDKNKAYSV